MPHFVTKILSFPENLKKEDFKGKDDKKTNQIHSGLLLIAELKKVFGRMAIGNKKYVEPGRLESNRRRKFEANSNRRGIRHHLV